MTYGFTKFPNTWRISLAKVRAGGCAYRVAFYLLDQGRWRERVTLSTAGMRNPLSSWPKMIALGSRSASPTAIALMPLIGLIMAMRSGTELCFVLQGLGMRWEESPA